MTVDGIINKMLSVFTSVGVFENMHVSERSGLMLDELLIEYAESFGENFPTFSLEGSMTENEMISVIKKCISEKQPYQINADDRGVYY